MDGYLAPNIVDLKNPLNIKLAHGYFPIQILKEVYVTPKMFDSGTIFPELDAPYGTDPEYVYDE